MHQRTASILIPTFNSAEVLPDCLASIAEQRYPKSLVEIIVADAGSDDGTQSIAEGFGARVVANPLLTGEAGKAAALKTARNEIVALIDSDNILPANDWLERMLLPFNDKAIFATEPTSYTVRRSDSYITRYTALLGMNDPLCLFLGNYDRYSAITKAWTGMPHLAEDCGDYLRVRLQRDRLPTIGANGFLIRREILTRIAAGPYLFDIDIVSAVLEDTPGVGGCIFVAKVKTGIVHIFSGSIATFIRKQRRRIKDYFYFSSLRQRKYPWRSMNQAGLVKFVLSTLTVLPLLGQALIGYSRSPDRAWLFHPIACWITLIVYAIETVKRPLGARPETRVGWSQ